MKKFLMGLALLLALQGCATLQEMEANNRAKNWPRMDQTLAHTWFDVSPDGRQAKVKFDGYQDAAFWATAISLRDTVVNRANVATVVDYMANFYTPPGEDDVLARSYIEAAKSRGHHVRMYRPDVNAAINRITDGGPAAISGVPRGGRAFIDLDNAMIEFDRQGRVVSALSRVSVTQILVGVTVQRYTTIHMGHGIAKAIENSLGNRQLENAYLRTY